MCSSPRLFAAYHVLHRLSVPRHPPCALSCLTFADQDYSSPRASPLRASSFPLVLSSRPWRVHARSLFWLISKPLQIFRSCLLIAESISLILLLVLLFQVFLKDSSLLSFSAAFLMFSCCARYDLLSIPVSGHFLPSHLALHDINLGKIYVFHYSVVKVFLRAPGAP